MSDAALKLFKWFNEHPYKLNTYVVVHPEPEWDELIRAGWVGVYNSEQPVHKNAFFVLRPTPEGEKKLEEFKFLSGCWC